MIIHPVRSRVESFDRSVTCEKRKSLVFSGLFSQNKVGEIHRDFVGVFNKTIIPLALVGYEMIIAIVGYLPSHIQRQWRIQGRGLSYL